MENQNALSTNVEIPDYQLCDFLESAEPYQFVYQFKDNKFNMKRILARVKEVATKVGFKNFVTTFNEYCKAQQTSKLTYNNSTQFEGQEKELFSGEYICDEYGIAKRGINGIDIIVCRHPIMPVQRLINLDTGVEWLKIAYRKGKVWRTILAEKTTIASAQKILQLSASGILVTNDNAKELSKYLLEIEELNYDSIPEQKSTGRLGWINGEFSPYVEGISFDGENTFKHIFQSVKSEGNRDVWVEAMRKVRAEKTPARFALASAFASIIIEPCGLLPFFVHLWGGTGVGKSVSNMICASVWANPRMGEYITTFNATLVGQEMLATFLNSLPVCIDELQIQFSNGTRDFDKIIYQLCEGVGRTRGSKFGGLQKINTWRNCFITNGEHPISNSASGGGAVNRIIEIECTEKVYSDCVGLVNILTKNYGFAGREFVEWLNDKEHLDRLQETQTKFFRELIDRDFTEKQSASASAILTADEIVTELIFQDDNALTIEDISPYLTSKSDVDVNSRAYNYLTELVARNNNKFYTNNFGEYQSEIWGKVDDGYIYIIKSVFDRELTNAGYNSTAFLSWAKRNGLLKHKENRNTLVSRINKSVVNCICVKAKEEIVEFSDDDISDDDLDDLPF
ncbi:MAG: DUF927 domain-containing protein [Oscillospiraceae bacterium]|nr:DUF927 domain-containing protein [Candidatus Ruminococcus equi]